MTRYATYHMMNDEGQEYFVTYDLEIPSHLEVSQTLSDNPHYIAKYPLSDEVGEIAIKPGSSVELIDNKIVATEAEIDPLQPILDAEAQRREEEGLRQLREYEAFLQTPEGKVAARYAYYLQHGEWPMDESDGL